MVFFRDQDLDPDAFLAFARRIGEPVEYPFVRGIDGYPEIIAVTKLPDETVNFGGIWHSDTVYLERPPMGTMLVAREVPPVGGDTLFANMYAAYEALSPGMQRLLDGLRAVNSSALADVSKTREDRIRDSGDATPTREYVAEHPVVRTHPETGRKALYVNVAHTARFVDMTEEESRPLLQFLFEHSVRPEFTCRFRWGVGSLALWDNRCAMHNPVNDYHGFTRRCTASPSPATCRLTRDPHRCAARSPWPTIPAMVRDRRAPVGDAEAVVDGDRPRRPSPTLARLGRPTRPRAHRAAGVEPGDRVAIWAPNSLEWIVAALGVTTAGGVLVPVNTRFKGAEAAYILARSGAARALHRPRVPRHRLPGAARRRRRRRCRRSSTRSCSSGDARRRASVGWDDVPRARRRGARRRASTRASPRSAPTTRATSCSRRAPPAARRAS